MPYTVTVRRADAFDAARLAEIYAYYVAYTAVTFDYDAPSALEFAEKVERVQRDTILMQIPSKRGSVLWAEPPNRPLFML